MPGAAAGPLTGRGTGASSTSIPCYPVDHVIDTLGAGEFARDLSVLKRGGRLVSLLTGPNETFAVYRYLPA